MVATPSTPGSAAMRATDSLMKTFHLFVILKFRAGRRELRGQQNGRRGSQDQPESTVESF